MLVFCQLVCVLAVLRIEVLGICTVLRIEIDWKGDNGRL